MIALDGRSLGIAQVAAIARDRATVGLTPDARRRVAACSELLDRMIADGTPIYGITTGFGALDGRAVSRAESDRLQLNLIRSHAAGVGEPMAADEVRAMMAIRANCLAGGQTGVRPATLEALLALVNAGLVPRVPRRGSVGACGDLAPLSHMALVLVGEGRARLGEGPWLPGAEALARAGLAPIRLTGRDGIALVNGTEQTTGIGCLAVHDARRLGRLAEAIAAASLEVLGAVEDSFDARVALAKPHPGQIRTSEALRRWCAGSKAVLAPRPGRLRDSLSLRCIPQVLGAVRDAIERAASILEIEINATNDNPIFEAAGGFVTSNSGNFHGQAAAEVLDALATALTSLAVIAERRVARLVDEKLSMGLPPFLIHPEATPGLNSGLMLAQYTAAALVAELRMRSVPAAIQSIPTCANTEDHVPMAPLAAERARFAVATARTVVAIEALAAAQAYAIRGLEPAPALAPILAAIRARVPPMVEDREVGADIESVEDALWALPEEILG
ncbi:MAG: aromatic amino acid ammonia-lyase [Geminicoccaceae bacterium]|nr:aromatic amino acid ammonia-lyase [Geminicoccaceae bacterium]MCX8102512.1 aromatic amino acid ammonia-lyase [Geminicoccaceae bacterium]MDW8369565.1 aromatic amino acid ammonia-lyase [Geminicoccaceae bacterium]